MNTPASSSTPCITDERESGLIPTEVWVLPRPRQDAYVGSFPLHFERKLWRTLGEPKRVLHPFGGLCEIGDSVDLNATTTPTFVGDAHDLTCLRRNGRRHAIRDDTYDLVVLDPPYSDEDAEWRYSTPPLRRAVYTREALRVLRPGGHLAIYQIVQPATPKGAGRSKVCRLVRRIVVLTRTGHAPRVCFVYEKLAVDA